MHYTYKILVLIASLLTLPLSEAFSQNIPIKPYFLFKENQVNRFRGIYSTKFEDTNNSTGIPVPPPNLPHQDSIVEYSEIIYKTVSLNGHKIYYAIDIRDTSKPNPDLLSSYFLSSALIFDKGGVLLAPVEYKADLLKLKLSDFKYRIPAVIKATDTVFAISDTNKKLLLYGFKKVTLYLNGKSYHDCLNFKAIERWSNATYKGEIWLSKQYGVLKWIRFTGRIETRDFSKTKIQTSE